MYELCTTQYWDNSLKKTFKGEICNTPRPHWCLLVSCQFKKINFSGWSGAGWRPMGLKDLHSSCPYSTLVYIELFSLQAVCELPLSQAVLQSVQAYRGAGGTGAERPAQKACPQSHECHQYTGGEPWQLRQGGLSASGGGQVPCTPTQGGACLLQGKLWIQKK